MTWDNFLDITADSYGLSDRQKQVFIARFSDQGVNDSNARIAAKLKLSEQDIERALREVYNLFKDDCQELASRTRGQAEKLRKWLKQKYAQEQQGQSVVIASVSKPSVINWSAICRQQNAKLRRRATEEEFELEIFVPLGLMERKQQQRRSLNQEMGMEQVYGVEEKAEVTRKFEHQEFLSYIGLGGKQAENSKNVAIIGEPGAGKTTLLANLAQVIDANQGLAMGISLGSLETGQSLADYLEQKWLKDALGVRQVSETDKDALAQRFQQGDVWLLLDGLDEMSASSPVEALTRIEREVRSGYLQKARVVLTCRVNVWDANLSNPLREFETYKTLEFAESQRDDFIGQWFTKKGDSALGAGLIAKLKESGRERIAELVKNPLRLVLLCRIWTLQAGELPETKAQFYQRYLPYFYEWKKEVRDLTQDDELQESLHQALGQLALAGLESDSRYRLPRKLARQAMGQALFQLAVDLGWLNIVDRDRETDEAVYAFFHPTFQEFFAACAVTDWDFFLPRDHVDCPVEGKVYRIFEAKWKEVILLWLGRGDVKDAEKEVFIEALVEFKDGCRDFYWYRAYFLAGAGIREFTSCLLADEIVGKLVRFAFESYNFKNTSFPKCINLDAMKSAKLILLETDRKRASKILISLLYVFSHNKHEIIEILEVIAYRNQESIATLITLIESSNYECSEIMAVELLGIIDPGNQKAITVLIDLINYNTGYYLRSYKEQLKAAKALLRIDPSNKEAIKTLFNLMYIYPSRDEEDHGYGEDYGSINSWAKETLKEFGVGNEIESNILFSDCDDERNRIIELINSAGNEYTRIESAESLGRIDPKNQLAISTLIKLINSASDEYTRIKSAVSLGRIDLGNQTATSTLIELIYSTSNESARIEAVKGLGYISAYGEVRHWRYLSNDNIRRVVVETLGNIRLEDQEVITILTDLISHVKREDQINSLLPYFTQIARIVAILKNYISDDILRNNFNLDEDELCRVLWKCAQILPYPEFYQAWHPPPITPKSSPLSAPLPDL